MIVEKYAVQMTPKLQRAICERLRLKRGEKIFRVEVLISVPPKRPASRKGGSDD